MTVNQSNRKTALGPLSQRLVRTPYTYLFLNILAIFFLFPLGERIRDTIPIIQILFFSMLLFVLRVLQVSRRVLLFFALMSSLSLASDLFFFPALFQSVSHSEIMKARILVPLIDGILVLSVIIIFLQRIFREQVVSADTILGGITVYFLFGILWTVFYRILLLLEPAAISVTDPLFPANQLLYFSFITLMTVGYGDIVPLTPIARNLAVLEAFTGQLYLAIFISRLVGLHLTTAKEKNDVPGGGSAKS